MDLVIHVFFEDFHDIPTSLSLKTYQISNLHHYTFLVPSGNWYSITYSPMSSLHILVPYLLLSNYPLRTFVDNFLKIMRLGRCQSIKCL